MAENFEREHSNMEWMYAETDFALHTVILWLTGADRLSLFLEVIDELRGLGIAVEALLAEETAPVKKEALYITDSGTCAEWLRRQKLPVLAYLHEDNRAGDFAGIRYGMEQPWDISADYLERIYRRYQNMPWEILCTERCRLRETTVEDVDGFVEMYKAPGITKFTEKLYDDPEQEKAYVREYIEKVYGYYEYGVWSVLWKETGELIGRAGFSERGGYDLPELGFVIALPWQGKGIATEICQAILQYGEEYLGFEAVQALVRPENTSSLALCKKLGFTMVGRVREPDHVTGISHEYCHLVWKAERASQIHGSN